MLNLAICGVTGRMGSTILTLACLDNEINISGAVAREENPFRHKTLDNFCMSPQNKYLKIAKKDSDTNSKVFDLEKLKQVLIHDSLLNYNNIDVVVDFSTPLSSVEHLNECLELKKPIFIGTTNFTEQQLEFITECSKAIPIIYAPNLAHNLEMMTKIRKLYQEQIEKLYNIEVIDEHFHSFSVDSRESRKEDSSNNVENLINTKTDGIPNRILVAYATILACKNLSGKSAGLIKVEDLI